MRVCVCVISNTNLTRFAAVPVELGLKHVPEMAAYFSKNIGIFLQGHFWRWFHTGFTHPLFIGDSLLPALNPLRVLRNGPYWGIGDMGRCDLFWSRPARGTGPGTPDRGPTGLRPWAWWTWPRCDVGRAPPCRAQGRRLDLGGPLGGRALAPCAGATCPLLARRRRERKRLSARCRRRMTD